jgi:hypothetical protein
MSLGSQHFEGNVKEEYPSNTVWQPNNCCRNLKSHMSTNFFDDGQNNYENLGRISSLQNET